MTLRIRLNKYLLNSFWVATRSQIEQAIVPGDGGIAMVGDSITHMGKWEMLFPSAPLRNFGIGGERSIHIIERLKPIVALRPGKLFLLIGTNDLALGFSPLAISANVEQLIDRLRKELPDCKLHIQGVMPRQKKFAARIHELNALYRKLAESRGITYIDLSPGFDDGSGRLRTELTEDNLHLNGAGYIVWRDLLRPFINA